jgi:hypothetical protein
MGIRGASSIRIIRRSETGNIIPEVSAPLSRDAKFPVAWSNAEIKNYSFPTVPQLPPDPDAPLSSEFMLPPRMARSLRENLVRFVELNSKYNAPPSPRSQVMLFDINMGTEEPRLAVQITFFDNNNGANVQLSQLSSSGAVLDFSHAILEGEPDEKRDRYLFLKADNNLPLHPSLNLQAYLRNLLGYIEHHRGRIELG